MAQNYKNPVESTSAHAVDKNGNLIATPEKLAYIVHVFEKHTTTEGRKAIATAINLAGNSTMSALPAFLQPIVLYAITQDLEKPWGYHPFHAMVKESMDIIADNDLPTDKRFGVAKVMLKHDDYAIKAWAKSVIVEKANFSDDQLKSLGLVAIEKVEQKSLNATNASDILSKLARKLGVNIAELTTMLEETEGEKVEQTT